MQTALNLLTREGAITVKFKPHLSAEHYAELIKVVEAESTPSKAALCAAIRILGGRWGRLVEITDGTDHDRHKRT